MYKRQKDGGLNYPLNSTIGFTSDWEETALSKCRGGSWGALETDGCWTYSDASIFLCGLPEQELTFLMTYSQAQPDAIVTFSSKGQILGEFDTNDLQYVQQLELNLPPAVLENGELELSITSSWKNASTEPLYGTKVTGVKIYDPNK